MESDNVHEAAEIHVDDVGSVLGTTFGPGPWFLVDQSRIDAFAEATEDRLWYHVDVERARRELPYGSTIAHGLLTLSLVPDLLFQVLKLTWDTRALSYGYDNVRFVAPVQAGDRIRLSATPTEVGPHGSGTLVRIRVSIEVERTAEVALVTDDLVFVFAEADANAKV